MSRKVGIIGHFGGSEIFLDGQTIKTKILFNELKSTTDWELVVVDTYYKKKNVLKLGLDTLKCIFSTKDIIVLLSGNGMRVYFPILYICSVFFGKHVYHDVIGGNLHDYVLRYPRYKTFLNSFRANWVETNLLKSKLQNLGIKNAEVIPNFKRLTILTDEMISKKNDAPYTFCTFSRVVFEKGIESAISSIESLNSQEGKLICTLDIYGSIDPNYKEQFEQILSNSSKAIRYCGIVPFDQCVNVIKKYYALLFPTFWEGEGFPGTIIDAYSSGLPVIASDWNSNCEVVSNLETGLIYSLGDSNGLRNAIQWAIDHKEEMHVMRKNCLKEAMLYQPEPSIKKIVDMINEGQK